MNPQEARERADRKQDLSVLSVRDRQALAEQAAADQAEEERVAREDAKFRAREIGDNWGLRLPCYPLVPPYLFADERSQRRVEEEARHERPLDDYSAWTDQNEQLI